MTSTEDITLGTMRLLLDMGYAPIREVALTNRRRADIVALDRTGDSLIVEVKSGLSDFRADRKWQEYLPYCSRFYFAVDADFPRHVLEGDDGLSGDIGIMLADRYGAEIIRPAGARAVNAARKKTLTLKVARLGAQRLATVATAGVSRPRVSAYSPSLTGLV